MPGYHDAHGRVADLHQLPKIRDRLSFLYLEHGRLDRDEKSVAFWTQEGKAAIPVASLSLLMLGPGTRVTHAAMMALADNACLAVWCGEEGVRFYCWGTGGTRSGSGLIRQARLWADEDLRLGVVRRMYEMRFTGEPPSELQGLTLQQLRGREGLRVRASYTEWSNKTGVPWTARNYDRDHWGGGDPVNRALSAANSCLYGICHAAIVAIGCSPALGFIHTGKQLSFVFDVADLYKAEISIPAAFECAAEDGKDLERRVRLGCRDAFRKSRLLERIVPDIRRMLLDDHPAAEDDFASDEDPALPTAWWGDADAIPGAISDAIPEDAVADGDNPPIGEPPPEESDVQRWS